MFARLKALIDRAEAQDAPARGDGELRLATAVLLVEAATLDGEFGGAEEAVIRTILASHFTMTPDEIDELLQDARAAHDESAGLVRHTRVIKDHFSEDERVSMMEMLWEVAYADGVLHDYEANLLRRISGLLYVPDRATGEARLRVLERLGIEA
jgi:uncharacterized tellurite resistance protein B-like protein